ncbi:MAG TPA: polynucleotide adenylyltransferase [Verrucomicrobiales bacterium]|nr:polynucleotide adenylyltransferase [Verrucomicrobiales bacterium]
MPVTTRPYELPLPEDLERILLEAPVLARAYVVGGGVRDALLGLPVKDLDIEVYGQSLESLAQGLAPLGRVDVVGRSFGVIKLTTRAGVTHDFSLPRRDSKVAVGHKGFRADLLPDLSLEEASSRRDFTLNSLLYDPRRREILDAHGGLEDLEARILRHTSGAFVEDPLRVLRGMQFVSRFNLTTAPATIELCRSIQGTHPELARERVRDEWYKWASRSLKPSLGLKFLADTGWVAHYPELAAMIGTPQDPRWHPEGDVFTHTGHCCDALATLPAWREAEEASRIAWMLAILTHDAGKPSTTRTEVRDGIPRIVSPGHEEAGGPLATTFLHRIGASNEILGRVVPLVTNHMAHLQTGTDRAIRRLANRLTPETVQGLCTVMSADALGRPPLPAEIPASIPHLLHRAGELEIESQAPRPILLGRHLLELGMKPGKEVGRITHAAFEAQLDGFFADLPGAWVWAERHAAHWMPPDVAATLRARLSAAG